MNAIAIAATAGLFVAGAAYAHGSLTQAPTQQVAGTLTCTTRPELSLVFGATPVADCTFVADRSGYRQSYAAVFHRGTQRRVADKPETVTWRVLTKDGYSRPGMLDGTFAAPAWTPGAVAATDMPALTGERASLKLVSHSARLGTAFAMDHARIAMAAVEPGFTR